MRTNTSAESPSGGSWQIPEEYNPDRYLSPPDIEPDAGQVSLIETTAQCIELLEQPDAWVIDERGLIDYDLSVFFALQKLDLVRDIDPHDPIDVLQYTDGIDFILTVWGIKDRTAIFSSFNALPIAVIHSTLFTQQDRVFMASVVEEKRQEFIRDIFRIMSSHTEKLPTDESVQLQTEVAS